MNMADRGERQDADPCSFGRIVLPVNFSTNQAFFNLKVLFGECGFEPCDGPISDSQDQGANPRERARDQVRLARPRTEFKDLSV